LIEISEGAVRADVVHERVVAMWFAGDGRTTRRPVALVKQVGATVTGVGTGRGSASRSVA
jgi:hypothetical protein